MMWSIGIGPNVVRQIPIVSNSELMTIFILHSLVQVSVSVHWTPRTLVTDGGSHTLRASPTNTRTALSPFQTTASNSCPKCLPDDAKRAPSALWSGQLLLLRELLRLRRVVLGRKIIIVHKCCSHDQVKYTLTSNPPWSHQPAVRFLPMSIAFFPPTLVREVDHEQELRPLATRPT